MGVIYSEFYNYLNIYTDGSLTDDHLAWSGFYIIDLNL